MSTIDFPDVRQFEPVVTKPVEIINSNMGDLSCQDVLKEMSQKVEENHGLSTPKMKKSKARPMYKGQYINEKGGVIIVKETGVSLHIPDGALSERTFISIEIKSAANVDMTGLDKSTSLTPIVSCQPDGLKFLQPVELIIPHCAEFDDIHLHKATARFVEGDVSVSTDSTNKQNEVRCVLKERRCHVYTTHFSDVVVGISNCLKKRMLVVPFTGGSTKLYVKVWIINDLPSEYTILLHEQKELNFVPFTHTGKFIFENHGRCSLAVQSSLNDKKLEEVSEDIDIKLLFRNTRSVHDFEMERTVTGASPKFVTVSLLFHLKEEIQDGNGVGSMQEQICAVDEIETQHGEVAQMQTESKDIIDQVFTYQTDIFKEIGTLLTDIFKEIGAFLPDSSYRLRHHKSELFTKVTSLQPAIFKKTSSFSEDIFWKLSPDEREMIKAISSFNTDILERVSTAQSEIYATLLEDFGYPYYTSRGTFKTIISLHTGTFKTIISLHTGIFERISTFIEDTLKMPPIMQTDLLLKVKTLELGIFGRIEALAGDLNALPYHFSKELFTKIATFATELFQRVFSFNEDFLKLSPIGLDDIATKVTVLVQDLLQKTSSFVKAQGLRSIPTGACKAILSLHTDIFGTISTFMEDTLKMPPPMQADLLLKVKTLELGIFGRIEALARDLNALPYHFSEEWILNERYPDITSKTRTFAAELFQRVSLFHEDFLRLSPMELDDIATKVTVLARDLLQRTSSFVQDIAQVFLSTFKDPFVQRRHFYYQDLTSREKAARRDIITKINDVHRGLFTDISTFVKGFRASMPSFGEDLFTQMSSLEADFSQLMSSIEKDLDESSSYLSLLASRLKFYEDSDESPSSRSKDPLPKTFKYEPRKSVSSFKKDSDETSSHAGKESQTYCVIS